MAVADGSVSRQIVPGIPFSSSSRLVGRSLTILTQDFASLDLLEEVGLLLIRSGREALLLGLIDHLPDPLSLGLLAQLGVFLLLAGLSPGAASELSPKLGVIAPLIVEVDGVGWKVGARKASATNVYFLEKTWMVTL